MKLTDFAKVLALSGGIAILAVVGCAQQQPAPVADSAAPRYQVDPFWPKPLKDNWIWGQVSSVTVDGRDHVWVLHRPLTLLDDSKGNLYTAEVGFGRRVQKFKAQ